MGSFPVLPLRPVGNSEADENVKKRVIRVEEPGAGRALTPDWRQSVERALNSPSKKGLKRTSMGSQKMGLCSGLDAVR